MRTGPNIAGQRGEGKVGCFLFLVALVLFVYVSTRTVPVYLDKIDFDEGLARLASQAGVGNWPNDTIIERVKALAMAKDFEVGTDGVRIRRPARFQTTPEIKISVTFERQVEFPGYLHKFHFETDVSSLVGSL